MKLVHVFTLRFSLLASLVLACWSVFFYFTLMDEVNDEMDDSLEDYAEHIIRRSLAGEPLPSERNGTNNQYFLRPVDADYAARNSHIRYEDREVYIKMKKEFEPARVLTYIFQRDDGYFMELEVSAPTIDKEDLRHAIFFWVVFLYGGLLLAIIAISVWVTQRNMRPLRTLLQWLDRYRPGTKETPPSSNTRIWEFRRLNQAMTQFAARNEELFEQQKTFIGNASHEMQTPLAICQNRIEMLLEDETLSEHQMAELVKTLRTLEGLSRMNRSLLLLCRIENQQFADTTQVDINALVETLVADYRTVFAHKRIAVRVEEKGCLRFEMNESLATTLVTNLLKNAFVHNVNGGHIGVTLTATTLRIANSGSPAALDAEQIFARFYHSGGKKSSTGLGLALAQAICKQCGLQLSYIYEGGEHVFTAQKINKG